MYLSQTKLKVKKRQENSSSLRLFYMCDYFTMNAAKAVVGGVKVARCL